MVCSSLRGGIGMKLEKQIYNNGKITIASRLSQEFYNYNVDTEALAFDRISAALYDLGQNTDMSPSGAIITLGTTVPVGAEVAANKIWQWLVIYVTANDKCFRDDQKFMKYTEEIAYKALEKLVAIDKYKAAIQIREDHYIVITSDD